MTLNRRLWVWSALGFLIGGTIVCAAESLRIVPLVSDDQVLVTFELADGYTGDVREAIFSGLRTTFTYDVELRMVVPVWIDRTIATAVVSTSDQYDILTRRHSLSRMMDGRVEETSVAENETAVKRWLTALSHLPLCRTSKLDPTRDYYVRIRARVRPRGTSLLGWATSITGQVKFTFVP